MSVYLDHAATTRVLDVAREAYLDASRLHGNPSSLHSSGRLARKLVEESREKLARVVGAAPHEVVLTGGGTEADNLAVKGLYFHRHREDSRRRRVVISAGEHHAVIDPAQWLADDHDAELVVAPIDRYGVIRLDALEELIEQDPASVALVSVLAANNEVGAVQPIAQVAQIAHRHGIPVHSDAVQALGWGELDFTGSGVDAMTITAHKIGGPVGIGALLLRRGIDLDPVLHGGGQERQIRSGTVDAAGLAAFAAAAEWTAEHRDETRARVRELRDTLVARVRAAVPEALLQGPPVPDPVGARLDNNAHFIFPGCEGDSLLYLLDARGVECSTGSACSAGVPQPSHVLLAMGLTPEQARGALRFSLGWDSTSDDVDALVAALPGAVERARNAGLASVVTVAS